jgi:FKBP-type peptidyl-prolyl cis-trans isomerase FklB
MRRPATALPGLVVLLAIGVASAWAQNATGKKTPAATSANTQPGSSASTQSATGAQTVTTLNDRKDKESYALGLNMGTNLRRQGVEIDPNILFQGLKDGYSGGKTLMTEDESLGVLTQLQTDAGARVEQMRQQAGEVNRKEGEAFLAANKTKPGVITLPSGLQYKVITQGTGPKPSATDTIVCNYRGTFINGTEFESSYKTGKPGVLPVNGVMKGWTEALQLMPVGSKWQLFVPADLAFGERGRGREIAPNATLIYEIELLSIQGKK